jgi:hypothetical protein
MTPAPAGSIWHEIGSLRMSNHRSTFVALATVLIGLWAGSAQSAEAVYKAVLNGEANLPEPIETSATGELTLTVSDDRRSIRYEVTVHEMLNPSTADLHLGPINANGPSVVKLFPNGGSAAKKGPFDGVLVQGTIDAGDLTGPMAGSPLEDLLAEIQAGNAYCNIHSNDGVDPPNSGPGDYRLGEIRGQIGAP